LFKRFKFFLFNKIKDNTLICIVLTILILLGICIGAFWIGLMPKDNKEILNSNINDYFLLAPTYSFDSTYIFKTSLLNNIIPVIILFITSIGYIGTIFTLAYVAFRGFCLGFTIAFLTESFGKKGFLFTLVALLPQNIIYIPALVYTGFIAINLSNAMIRLKRERFMEDRKKHILKYLTYDLVAIAALLIASFIEAYITPIFIKTLTPYL